LDQEGNAKIGDWGYAAHWTSYKKKHRGVGSLHYVAHEVLFGKEYTGPEVDIGGLGNFISFIFIFIYYLLVIFIFMYFSNFIF
jgi:serine/threonine protein kinase